MHFLHSIPLAVCLMGASSIALASTTALAVKGAITPNACEPTMSAGGEVDFGKMAARDLDAEQHTPLPNQSIHLRVRCEAPTFFTLNTIDNRAGSSTQSLSHGLGMTPADEKIGYAAFHLYTPTADGVPITTITSLDGGVTWGASSLLNHSHVTAPSRRNQIVPIAVQDFDAELRLYTRIAPADSLTLTDEVPVDGHATVQLNYL